jgi:WD40 repeat protein
MQDRLNPMASMRLRRSLGALFIALIAGISVCSLIIVRLVSAPPKCIRLPEHTKAISGLAFAPDGDSLVTVAEEGTISLYSLVQRTVTKTIDCGPERVSSMFLGSNGATIFAGFDNGTVKAVRLSTGRVERVLALGSQPIWCVCIDRGERNIAAAGPDQVLRIWDLGSPLKVRKEVALTSLASSVAFSADDGFLTLGAVSKTGHVALDMKTGSEVIQYDPAAREASCACFLGTVHSLAVGGRAGRVTVWDVDNEASTVVLTTGKRSWVTCLATSPDAKLVAAGDEGGVISIWDIGSGRRRGSWQAHDAVVLHLAFSNDGSILASACADIGVDDAPGHSEIGLWDVKGY